MTMYVLTEGWYADTQIKGVTYDETQARAWADSDMYRDHWGPFEMGWPSGD
jgi:hypothetical protein